ncbi:MAG: TIGR02466 family protein [Pseudomonadota bacterium]
MSGRSAPSIRSLFPTRLYEANLGDTELVADLEAAAWMLEAGDAAGRAWCEENLYPGYTSYASLGDLAGRATAFDTLADHLQAHAERFAAALEWDLDGRRLALDALWVNILGEGGVHSGHIHPGSVLSGTVYVVMPPGAGALKLEDPRLPLMMGAPQLEAGAGADAQRFVYLTPTAGTVLMWESWLRHEVIAGRSEEPRISISFNFGLAEAG